MPVGFCGEAVSLTDLKTKPGRVVKHTAEEERAFMRAVVGAWPIWMRDAKSVWRRSGQGSA